MIVITIMTHALPSMYREPSSYLRKFLESFVQLVFSAVDHPAPLPPFEEVQHYYYRPREVEGCNSSKFYHIIFPLWGGLFP